MGRLEGTPVFPINGETEYSYTSDFTKKYSEPGQNALSNLRARQNAAAVHIARTGRNNKALAQMVLIKNAAYNSEIAFLERHGFTNGGKNWSQLITGINYILGTRSSFERNMNLLSQVAKGERREYRDLSKFFMEYLQDEVYTAFDELSVTADMGGVAIRAIQGALKRMQEAEDTLINGKVKTHQAGKKQEALHAFEELYQQITAIRSNTFFTKIVELFRLDQFIEEVRLQLLMNPNLTNEKHLKINPKGGTKRYSGSLLEIIDEAIGTHMNFQAGSDTVQCSVTAEQVGGFNFKPDVILASVDQPFNYDEIAAEAKKEEESGSVRAAGVKTMDKLYQELEKAKGEIVLISDKNYVIDQAFLNGTENRIPGFGAQSPTNLNNLQALFGAINVKGINVNALIDYLANVGNGMIIEDIDDNILKTIATQAADFLFDDASLSINVNAVPNGVNIVHVFNLSGIYVPLSFVLDGMIGGLKGIVGASYEDYVDVSFNSGTSKPVYEHGEDWASGAFDAFRAERMSTTTITVHFLRDFARIITSAVSI